MIHACELKTRPKTSWSSSIWSAIFCTTSKDSKVSINIRRFEAACNDRFLFNILASCPNSMHLPWGASVASTTLWMNDLDVLNKHLVFPFTIRRFSCSPCVVPTGRYIKQTADEVDGKRGLLRLDDFVEVYALGLTKKATDVERKSRSWRCFLFSRRKVLRV